VGVNGGLYIVVGSNGKYGYSPDLKNWTPANMWENVTHHGELRPPFGRLMVKVPDIRYGIGKVDGTLTNMFFARKIALIRPESVQHAYPQETDMYLYSTDGIYWEALATAIITSDDEDHWWFSPVDEARLAALDFQPRRPSGGYSSAPLDGSPSVNYSSYMSSFGRVPDVRYDVNVKDLEFAEVTPGESSQYRKWVVFFAVGNDKLFAFGTGSRAAFSHVGAYWQPTE
jgi:hypothetical protein